MKKYLLFISLAFIIGLSLSSVQALSPFTAIGNLEMEVMDAINEIIDALNIVIFTQNFEQAEQDGIQIDISNLQGNQAVIFSSLTAINSDISNLEGNQTIILSSLSNVIISLNAEIVRIDSLSSIQIAEQSEQDGIQLDIAILQEQTKSIVNGKFSVPGIIVNPTQERAIGPVAVQSHLPIIVDFEFTSFQNHIVFTNGTIVDIPGPHLLESFVNSVDVFFKERLVNGTIVNHPLCSITAGDSISECNLIGFNTTVVPQRPTVSYMVDSDAPTNIYTVFDYEVIFSITTTTP